MLALYSSLAPPTSAIVLGLSFSWSQPDLRGFSGYSGFPPCPKSTPSQNIWPGCCAPGSRMTIWRQSFNRHLSYAFGRYCWAAPFAIQPSGLQVEGIFKHYYYWKKCYMKCGVWNQMKIWSSHLLDNLSNCLMNLKNVVWNLHLISNIALHITFLSYDIPFTGKHEPNKLTCSQLCEFVAQLVRAMHRHRRGHGFEPRWITWIIQFHETIA